MIKVVFEDSELEEFAMDGESNVAVPFQVTEYGGDVTVLVYSRFSGIAEEFADKYGDCPFTKDAKDFIESALGKTMEKAGYTYENEYDHTVFNYEADSATPLARFEIPTVFIDTDEKLSKYYLSTVRDFEIEDGDGNDVAFAVVDGDVVKSISTVNDFSDDGTVEINVETAKSDRSRGYASAVVSDMCRYLISRGERVSYRCRSTNVPSIKVAEKVGLKFTGKTFSFVCYRD